VVLLVRHLLHPDHIFSIKRFLDRDVGHRRGGARAVPVFMAGRAPDDVARADFDNRFTLALRPAAPCSDNEGLAQRVCMPRTSRTRFKGNACA